MMEKFGKFMLGFMLFVVNIALTGFTVSTLWAWFVVPLGVVALGGVHAYGIATLIHYLTAKTSSVKVEDGVIKQLSVRLGLTVGALLVGYVTVQFL